MGSITRRTPSMHPGLRVMPTQIWAGWLEREGTPPRKTLDVMELRWPFDVIHLVEPGELDDRARLAFGAGQCHGLALALKDRHGWPLVAVDDEEGRRIHICLRRPDGGLIDANGSHTDREFMDASPGCSLHDINEDAIADLVDLHGWAEPEVEKAKAWIEAVLEQASDPSQSRAPLQTPALARICNHENFEVRFVWTGDPAFDIHVRPASPQGDEWVRYAYLELPPDTSGHKVVDFRPEIFLSLTEAFLRWQFDPTKAQAKLATT
jgi:hypothetical protein